MNKLIVFGICMFILVSAVHALTFPESIADKQIPLTGETAWMFMLVILLLIILIIAGFFYFKHARKERKKKEISQKMVQLRNYIASALNKGYAKEQIRQNLLKSGWTEERINDVFVSLKR